MPGGIQGVYPLDTDSGWKDAGALGAGWTADTKVVRRYGCLVNLVVKNLDYDTSGSTTALTLPKGFRPDYALSFLAHDGTNPVVVGISTAGVVTVPTTEDDVEINVTFMTSEVWPS